MKYIPHPLLLLKDSSSSSAKRLEIPESRPDYCPYCYKCFKSVKKHWAKSNRCRMQAKASEIARSKERHRKAVQSHAHPHLPPPEQHPHLAPNNDPDTMADDMAGIMEMDENHDTSQVLPDPRRFATEFIEGITETFDDNGSVSTTESRPSSPLPSFDPPSEQSQSQFPHPPMPDSTQHDEAPPAEPKRRQDNDGFLPGCIRHFPENRRAGAPVSESPDQPPCQYETPYDTWHREWKECHPDLNSRWAPFSTRIGWCLAEWLMDSRVGKGQIDRLLAIPGVRYR